MKASFSRVVPSEGRSELAANSKFFHEPQFVDDLESMEELLLERVITWQLHDVLPVSPDKSGWQAEEVRPDRVHRDRMIFTGQADPFEPMHDVGGKEQQLEKGNISSPALRGDFAQRVIIEEFPVVLLRCGANIVEEIDPPRTGGEIGHKNMVGILSILEERQLLGFLRIFRNGAPHDNETVRLFPLLGLITELAELPSVVQGVESDSLHGFPQGRMFLGHDDITAAALVEEFDHVTAVEPGVHAETDATASHLLRGFGQAHMQEGDDAGGTGRVARAQSPMPEFLQVGFETEKGMIGTPPRFLGIVSNRRFLGLPVNNDDNRVYIEGQAVTLLRPCKQVVPQAVVKPHHLPNLPWCQTLEKTTECRLVRKMFEPQHFQEGSVVLQDLGLVDTPQPHDDGVDQSQDELRRMIAFVSTFDPNVLLKQLLQAQLAAKTLN